MASILNQTIDQGTTYSKSITVYETDGTTIQNLTGYTAASQLRKNYTSTASTTAIFGTSLFDSSYFGD